MIKKLFHLLPLSIQNSFRDTFGKKVRQKVVAQWVKNNSPVPAPHYVKQDIIDQYGKKYACPILVETGTYLGDMIEAQRNDFKQLYSVELNETLHTNAVSRFKNFPHISILKGDSGKVLFELVPKLNGKTLFWLDGHYSGGVTSSGEIECPIYKELDAIFNHNNYQHIILIDDARCFDGTHDYPTMQELERYVANRNAAYKITVAADIIRITIN